MQKVKKEVKNEYIEYAEIRIQDAFEVLKENVREEKMGDVEFLEFGTYDMFEEQKERVKKEKKNEARRCVLFRIQIDFNVLGVP